MREKKHDLSKKSDKEIQQWMRNHELAGAIKSSLYRDLVEEAAKRDAGKGLLDIEKSLAALVRAAQTQRFVTYGDLAKASAVPWSKARRQMSGAHGHLDRVLEICHVRGLPMLTALCVNESGREGGELELIALSGFTAAARRLNHRFTDDRAFHAAARDECIAWGATLKS